MHNLSYLLPFYKSLHCNNNTCCPLNKAACQGPLGGSPVVHWVLARVAGSSPAVAHLTAKSPRRSSPDQGVGPLHSVESSRASCNSRCRKAGSRPDMATSPCLAPKTKIVADWPKFKKKKKKKKGPLSTRKL